MRLDARERQVVVTSHLFPDMKFSLDRLRELSELVGKDHLVVDVRYTLDWPLSHPRACSARAAAAEDAMVGGWLQ